MTKVFCKKCNAIVAEFYGPKAPMNLSDMECHVCGSVNLRVEAIMAEKKKVAFDIFINNKDTNENIHEGFLYELKDESLESSIKDFTDKAVECFVKLIKNKEGLKKITEVKEQ